MYNVHVHKPSSFDAGKRGKHCYTELCVSMNGLGMGPYNSSNMTPYNGLHKQI